MRDTTFPILVFLTIAAMILLTPHGCGGNRRVDRGKGSLVHSFYDEES